MDDHPVTSPVAHRIWTKAWTIRAKYYFLIGKLAGLGASLKKDELFVVLRRLAEVRDRVAQISLTIIEGFGVAAPCLAPVIQAAYNVAVDCLSPFTCAACSVRSCSQRTPVTAAEVQENNSDFELPEACPIHNTDTSVDESAVQPDEQIIEDLSFTVNRTQNLENETSSKNIVAAGRVNDNMALGLVAKNEVSNIGGCCGSIVSLSRCRVNAKGRQKNAGTSVVKGKLGAAVCHQVGIQRGGKKRKRRGNTLRKIPPLTHPSASSVAMMVARSGASIGAKGCGMLVTLASFIGSAVATWTGGSSVKLRKRRLRRRRRREC